MDTADPLKKNLDWYISNQKELAAKHNGKILLIVNEQLRGVFDTLEEAYASAIKDHKPGTFTLQPCSPNVESYTMTLFTPAFSVTA